MLKYFIIPLLFVLITPALLPSQYSVEKKIIINETRETIFSELVNLELWKEWSPWLAKDPKATFSFQGIQGVVGSSQTWSGEIIGSGTQTLIELEEPRFLKMKLTFTEPQESIAESTIELEDVPQGVQVTWKVQGPLSYPMGRVYGLFMNQIIGGDFNDGLKRLKARLETTKS